MTGGRYATKLATRLVLCGVLAVAIVGALMAMSGGSDDLAMLALVGGFLSGLPPTVLLFLLVIGPSMGRARTLGLPLLAGLVVPGVLACELSVFLAPIPLWRLVGEMLLVSLPPFQILALAVALWWSVARETSGEPGAEPPLWSVRGPIGLAVLIGLGVFAVLGFLTFVPRLLALVPSLQGIAGFANTMQAWVAYSRPVAWGGIAVVGLLILLELLVPRPAPPSAEAGDEDRGGHAPAYAPRPAPLFGPRVPAPRKPAFGRRSQPAKAIG